MELHRIRNKIIKDLAAEIPELEDPLNQFSINLMKSRKNIVCELKFEKKPKKYPKTTILKLFRTDFSDNEYEILLKFKNQDLSVPNVLLYHKPYLLLEKLTGENLCDYINDKLKNTTQLSELDAEIRTEVEMAVFRIAEWLSVFHEKNLIKSDDISEIIVLNKGDTRLRDFIYNPSNKKIQAVDFEEAYEGNHIDDLAWICCSLLDTAPGIFELSEPRHKIELINLFLNEYYNRNTKFYFSFDYFASVFIEYLNIVIERRSLEFGPIRKQNILRKISKGF